jgi:hypothetical protein
VWWWRLGESSRRRVDGGADVRGCPMYAMQCNSQSCRGDPVAVKRSESKLRASESWVFTRKSQVNNPEAIKVEGGSSGRRSDGKKKGEVKKSRHLCNTGGRSD